MKRLSYGYRDEPCHLPSRGTIAAKRACSTLAVCADKPARRIAALKDPIESEIGREDGGYLAGATGGGR